MRFVVFLFAVIACSVVCSNPENATALAAALDSYFVVEKSRTLYVDEADLHKFEDRYWSLCNKRGIHYSGPCTIIEETAKILKIPLETVRLAFLLPMAKSLLGPAISQLLALKINPNDSKNVVKIEKTAFKAVYLIFESCQFVIEKFTPIQATKFLELSYRFGPGLARYEMAFKHLLNHIKNGRSTSDACSVLSFCREAKISYQRICV